MPLLDPVTMSTPTRQAPDGRDKPKEAAKPMQPVVLFGDGMARAADGLSLLLLAGWLRLRFSSLVADPVSELVDWVQILAALQSAWVVLCCPPLGYHKKGVKPGFWPAFLAFLLAALTIPLLHVIFVLFGAPLLTHPAETFLCAAILAVLSVYPIFYTHGVDSRAWKAVCGINAPLDETFCGFWGGIVGAWLGAVPIPLDWDREWQKWPVTIVVGIVVGHIIGRLVGGVAMLGAKNAAQGRGAGAKAEVTQSKEE